MTVKETVVFFTSKSKSLYTFFFLNLSGITMATN